MARIILVDGDPMVAHINRMYVEKDPRFEVTGEVQSRREALSFLEREGAELMLLDARLPDGDGLELLREVLARGLETRAILITVQNDAETLRRALQLGAVDYLIKPFSYERLKRALDRYAAADGLLRGLRSVDEETVAHLLYPETIPPRPVRGASDVERRMMACFGQGMPDRLTAKEMAERLGMSVVTARRHLKRLTAAGRLIGDMDYNTGGQPRTVYRLP